MIFTRNGMINGMVLDSTIFLCDHIMIWTMHTESSHLGSLNQCYLFMPHFNSYQSTNRDFWSFLRTFGFGNKLWHGVLHKSESWINFSSNFWRQATIKSFWTWINHHDETYAWKGTPKNWKIRSMFISICNKILGLLVEQINISCKVSIVTWIHACIHTYIKSVIG